MAEVFAQRAQSSASIPSSTRTEFGGASSSPQPLGGESRRTRNSRSPWLHIKFKVSLGYVRPSAKSKEGKARGGGRREEGKRRGKEGERERRKNSWISLAFHSRTCPAYLYVLICFLTAPNSGHSPRATCSTTL